MTVGERLREAAATLALVSDTPRLDAEILLAHALGMRRAKLLAELRGALPDSEFEALLARRLNHEPIAYILGEWEFYSLSFACRAPILVPRPETEHLVEVALAHLRATPRPRVLDLCTGTGCVAIAVAKNLPDAAVTAVDLNPSAVALARENAARLRVEVTVLEGDLFAPLDPHPPFDAIVANPPYVSVREWDSLPEVIRKHEDPMALLSGDDGLDLIRGIASEAGTHLSRGGLLAMEIGEDQGAAAQAILNSHGFGHVQVLKDLAGHDRIVHGTLR